MVSEYVNFKDMIHYLGLSQLRTLIQKIGFETIMQGLEATIEEDFRQWEDFKNQPRHASHFNNGVIELMVTHTETKYSFKYVNGHPQNSLKHLLSVTGFGVLADAVTGYPIFLSEMTVLTAFRTAASSALAAKYLAKSNSRKMAIIGTGAQSEFQALAFKSILGITDFYIYDIDHKSMSKFHSNLSNNGINITLCSSLEEAIKCADIVTLCTTNLNREGLIKKHHLIPGQHYNAVGGDSPGKVEISKDALNQMSIFVELTDQTLNEGEIKQLTKYDHVTELWQVIQKKSVGRVNDAQITIFDSVGYAIEDFSTLRFIYELAQKHDLLRTLDLIPDELGDPKNIFELIR